MVLYILINKASNNYYIGTSKNITRRLKEHNWKNHHYTSKIIGEWKLVFNKDFDNETEARQEEKRLKKAKNKKYIQWYIKNKGR